ncbi:MAG: glycerol-3-phosphate acyltransferase, partial [Actinomycetota bacterium]
MRTLLRAVLAAGLGYLLGSVPSADVATRLAGGPDLRTAGSGNPGAANAAQVLGARYGLTVLAVDIAKGAGAAMAGRVLHGPAVAQVASSSAVIGHCFPPWSGFKGGKGVATGVGQVLATFPAYFPIDLTVAVATFASPRWRQRSFPATAAACAVWVAAAALWWRRGWSAGWGVRAGPALPVGAAVSSAVIVSRFIAARGAVGGAPAP